MCSIEVWALKIKYVTRESDGIGKIVPMDKGYGVFTVGSKYMEKHNPEDGGYYVKYEDGYESYSPAEAFAIKVFPHPGGP